MIAGFTGTRKGMTKNQLIQFIKELEPYNEIHLGDCIGADAEAWLIAKAYRLRLVGHPPVKSKLRAHLAYDFSHSPLGYIERNHEIVDWCDTLFVAPEGPEENHPRSGTWATYRYAKKEGAEIFLLDL